MNLSFSCPILLMISRRTGSCRFGRLLFSISVNDTRRDTKDYGYGACCASCWKKGRKAAKSSLKS